MKKLDEWLIEAKCVRHRLFFGKQPGIDGIIVVIVLVIIAVSILDVKKWTELENVRTYYDFFMEHEKEFK